MVEQSEMQAYEDESPPPNRSSLVLWLVILCLGILILPMVLLSTSIRELNAPLQAEVEALQATLAATPAPPPDEDTLNRQLLEVMNQTSALASLQSELALNPLAWPQVMASLLDFQPTEMRINGVAQHDTSITVTGEAAGENIVMDYVLALQANEMFERVAIQSMELTLRPTAAIPAPVLTLTPEVSALQMLPVVTPLFNPGGQSISFTLSIDLSLELTRES